VNAAAFDTLAAGYDTDFTDTPVGQVLRRIVWARAAVLFRPGQRVLELGCGTGEDAVELARRGVQVVATDASQAMINVARTKAQRYGCNRVEFHCMPMEQVAVNLADQRFDGVFSNFGAVNCVRDVPALAAALAKLLKPGAPLLWVVMGRHVPWEWLWFALRGQPLKGLRRLRRDGVPWRGLAISYPTPSQLNRAVQPHFEMRAIAPLGCVLPPTYAAPWLNHSPRVLAALTRVEHAAQRAPGLARISDHYLFEARRATRPIAVPFP
jgi:ubiquinone/menaquinone biosynthesis C-methylase UbiE